VEEKRIAGIRKSAVTGRPYRVAANVGRELAETEGFSPDLTASS
jgi:hypothetical protein